MHMTLTLLVWHGADVYPWAFGLIWPVLIIVAGVLIASAMRRPHDGRPPPSPPPGTPAALDILEQRYARGEIGREEFLERRAVLTGGQPPGGAPTSPPSTPAPPPASQQPASGPPPTASPPRQPPTGS
jgi:uncharacterized membrane protein